jgi:hypothetical protein
MNAAQAIAVLANRPAETVNAVEYWASILFVKFTKGSSRFVSLKKFINLAASEPKALTLTVPAGRNGAKPWIAKITGCDARYALSRNFIDGDITWAGRKGAEKGDFVIVQPGLYQAGVAGQSSDDYFVVESINGSLEFRDISWQEAKDMARDFDSVMDLLA